jgi:hypothetical protein
MIMSIKNCRVVWRGCVVKMTMTSQNTLTLYKFIHKNYLQHCESVRVVNGRMDTFAL